MARSPSPAPVLPVAAAPVAGPFPLRPSDPLLQVSVLREVAERLLGERDLDQVLLSISDRTLALLDADICGVMLLEGDEVAMRSCVGHRVVETARLRMRAGQGLAGLVLRLGEPARVDSYLDDRSISADFVPLAVAEATRSALAVPLRLQGALIGVLEVWRRRDEPFTDDDEQRMVALAAFATIAIDNARLAAAQTNAVAELKTARDALQEQVERLARASRLQHRLLSAVTAGGGLTAIAGATADELSVAVGIYGPDGQLVAHHPGRPEASGHATPEVPARLPSGRPRSAAGGDTGAGGLSTGRWVEQVVAEGDELGAVCLTTAVDGHGEPAALMDVAISQVAMACSLAQLRERASRRAHDEALDELLWDLVQPSRDRRTAAQARARQLKLVLRSPLRVAVSRLQPAAGTGADLADHVHRDVVRALQQAGGRRGLVLCGVRGDLVVGVVSHLEAPDVRALVADLSSSVRDQTGLQVRWGVSRPQDDAGELCSALAEARTALSAAQRLGSHGLYLYEELGIVRLLLGPGDAPDLQAFVDDVTGPLLAYDRENDGALVRTLRAYFDADCSQKVAAERLFVHHKTLRYRLERIKELTGLDLNRHEDRVRADVALRLLQVSGAHPDPGGAEGAAVPAP